jgi:hypothetical protein
LGLFYKFFLMSDSKKEIESIGLVSCELGNDACNFCDRPENGVYAQMTGLESADIAYFICGRCAIDVIKSGVKHCSEIVLPQKTNASVQKEGDCGCGK